MMNVPAVLKSVFWVLLLFFLCRGETSHQLPEQHRGRLHRADSIFWWTCNKVCPPQDKISINNCKLWQLLTRFNRLDNEAKKLIAELGSTRIGSLGFRDNWLFVGAKGAGKKNLFEKVTAQTGIECAFYRFSFTYVERPWLLEMFTVDSAFAEWFILFLMMRPTL